MIDVLKTYNECNLTDAFPWIELELDGCDGLIENDDYPCSRCDNCPIFNENLREEYRDNMVNIVNEVRYYGNLPVHDVARRCEHNQEVIVVEDGIPTWLGQERSQDESKE